VSSRLLKHFKYSPLKKLGHVSSKFQSARELSQCVIEILKFPSRGVVNSVLQLWLCENGRDWIENHIKLMIVDKGKKLVSYKSIMLKDTYSRTNMAIDFQASRHIRATNVIHLSKAELLISENTNTTSLLKWKGDFEFCFQTEQGMQVDPQSP
jgi:hypothetical protein